MLLGVGIDRHTKHLLAEAFIPVGNIIVANKAICVHLK